jgi:D-alanine-D-alanine ligase
MLEMAGVPYVVARVLGAPVDIDHGLTKVILAQAGLPQTPWVLVQRHEWQRDPQGIQAAIAEQISFPCFVKPANLGSSVGVTKVHGLDELGPALALAAHYDRRVIVEQGVNAREIELSVLGNDEPRASVPGEIISSNEFYDYDAKYVDGDSQLIIPADLPSEIVAEIQRVAVEAFKALDLAGLARVDFFVERTTGEVLLNEVNTIPGFTATSMYPLLWEASGLPIRELVQTLIALAIERHTERGNAF